MKKLITGLAWQAMGFLGAVLLVCTATIEGPWDYNGITGLPGALLGTNLVIPLLVCGVLFVVGSVYCYQAFQEDKHA